MCGYDVQASVDGSGKLPLRFIFCLIAEVTECGYGPHPCSEIFGGEISPGVFTNIFIHLACAEYAFAATFVDILK